VLVCSVSASDDAAVRRYTSAPRVLSRAAAAGIGSAGPARTASAAKGTTVLLVLTGIVRALVISRPPIPPPPSSLLAPTATGISVAITHCRWRTRSRRW